ncbi:diphosphomevalonate decarboxylase-like [Branchiostoma lanceolatum]|uniref:diphosphomevalonate decarboxylase-like n=1 Tax=Branchiostoma lanceolatum TaxID=7740 RepID=UPI003451C4D9
MENGRANMKPVTGISQVTCTAPVNIAVIKYWGKRDERLVLPINPSLSVTLSQDQLCARTTVAASLDFKKDRIWLNGQEQSIDAPRLQKCLGEIRRLARKRKHEEERAGDLLGCCVHICSENNFPTAAGLASSAAGYACLVQSLAKLFNIDGDVSHIARQGSGSACRSMYGGFVEWTMGKMEDGSDSIAKQIAPAEHWPELRVLVAVVNAGKKAVGSTEGMQTTVKTSALIKYRAEHVVPSRQEEMRQAVLDRDFQTFGEITMKDSNQFHATCLDTYPPIFYLNETSKHIIHLVHRYNQHQGKIRAAYTFDAGPNAVLYLLQEDVPEVLALFHHFFPETTNNSERQFVQGLPDVQRRELSADLLDSVGLEPSPGSVQYIIHTKAGEDPQVLTDPQQALLDENGLPKKRK